MSSSSSSSSTSSSSSPLDLTPESKKVLSPTFLSINTVTQSQGITDKHITKSGDEIAQGLDASLTPSPMQSLFEMLAELQKSQAEFTQVLTKEHAAFTSGPEQALSNPAFQVFDKIPSYEKKVKKMVNQMNTINTRMNKLKTRTAKLVKVVKEKEKAKA